MFSVENLEFKGVDNLENADFKVYENGTLTGSAETFRYIKKINTLPYKLKTVIMLDNSSSISAGDLAQIKAAAITLVGEISDKQEIAIYSFSSTPTLIQDFTNDIPLLTSRINSISSGFASTNLYGSFITGIDKCGGLYTADTIEQGFLVVFTDGDDTQASSTLQQAIDARGTTKAYMIGLGADINPAHLNSLSNTGPYCPVTDITELTAVFLQIQADILQYSNSFYLLNYMSPKRNGTHTLRLEVNENGNTGTDSYYESPFSAVGFADVFSGVYVNTSPSQLYGIETITAETTEPIELKAVTYWADQPPSYTWTSSNTDIVTVTPSTSFFNRAQLNFPGIQCGTANVTVTDVANSYTKVIEVTEEIMNVFEFVFTADPTATLGWETKDVLGAESWHFNSSYTCMEMSGYSAGYYTNEDWLISPKVNLCSSTNPYMLFNHTVRYGSAETAVSVWAATDYDGTNVTTANWVQLIVPIYPTSTTLGESGNVDLTQFAGQSNVSIGFKYTSTTSSAVSWYIGEVVIYE
jgi:hypothetical protein